MKSLFLAILLVSSTTFAAKFTTAEEFSTSQATAVTPKEINLKILAINNLVATVEIENLMTTELNLNPLGERENGEYTSFSMLLEEVVLSDGSSCSEMESVSHILTFDNVDNDPYHPSFGHVNIQNMKLKAIHYYNWDVCHNTEAPLYETISYQTK